MNRDDIINDYFDWMCHLVTSKDSISYRKLFTHLHRTEFYAVMIQDDSRIADGRNLRYRFGYDCKIPNKTIEECLDTSRTCSVLELLVALALRVEEQIMWDSDLGDRIGQWFWQMLVNLGLGGMNDDRYDRDEVDDILKRFINRQYSANGRGGLFIVEGKGDMRDVEIWYQMNAWLISENERSN